nr:unnamed protein product [Leishmania braziliensis]
MRYAPQTPPPPPAGLNRSEHVEEALSTRLQGSSSAHKTATSDTTPPDPRLGHVMNTSSASSSSSSKICAEHMQHAAEVAASNRDGLYQAEQKPFIGTSAVALQPPPPLRMRHSTTAPAAATPFPSSSASSTPLGDRAGDGESNHSNNNSSSSYSASRTSSHYLFAIQRDLEAIVRLQQLQLQERRVPLPSEASTTESMPGTWIGAKQMAASPLVTDPLHHSTTFVARAAPAIHLQSIDHAKRAWLDGEGTAYATPRQQQQPPQSLPLSCHARFAGTSASPRTAKVADAAPQLSLDSCRSSVQGVNDMLLSPPRHDTSGASISAGTSIPVMRHQSHQQQPQPPPPPPSSSPIPASLVEYQRYLMQLEHQQRQHREVLRRHRKQHSREEVMAAAQRGGAPITIPISTATPPRQRTGIGTVMEDRRNRSPPLAMMMQAIRQRRGDERGVYSAGILYGCTTSSDSSATVPSAMRQRSRHSQKQRHPMTTSPTAAAAPSRERGGGRRASVRSGHGRSAEDTGPSAARATGAPGVALIDVPARSRYRRSTPQPKQRRDANVRNSATNGIPRHLNPQQPATAVVKEQDGQRLPPHTPPLVVNSLARSLPLVPGPTDTALLQAYADTAALTGPQSSSPVEAFADALLMDVSGALRTGGGGGSAPGPLPAPPPPLMPPTHSVAGTAIKTETTAVTTVGGTETAPPPIIISSSSAVVMPPGDIDEHHQSEAVMAPAVEQKAQHHRSDAQHNAMDRSSNVTTMTTTTPASSATSSSSSERGASPVKADGGAGRRVKGGGATSATTCPSVGITAVLQHPDTVATAYSGHQQRSHNVVPILVHGNNGFHWRVTRHRSRGAGATVSGAETHHSHPDAHRKYRCHLHNGHHHRSMEGISSTTPEHGTGTPRSSRYRYNSSSTTRQRKQPQQPSKHSPRNASSADTRGDGHDGFIKHPADAARQRPVSPGHGGKAQRRAIPRNSNRDATTAAAAAFNNPPAGIGVVSRSAHSRPPPPTRSAAAVWQDVKLMWAPAPVLQSPFAAVYRYHPHPCLTSSQGQQQQSTTRRGAPPSAVAGTSDESARSHTPGRAVGAGVRERGASRTLTGAAGAAPSLPSASAIRPTQQPQQKASAAIPLLCMTDSLIGAALRDVLPVCRARQREVAREVARRRYQHLPTGIGGGGGGVASSATVL